MEWTCEPEAEGNLTHLHRIDNPYGRGPCTSRCFDPAKNLWEELEHFLINGFASLFLKTHHQYLVLV